MAANFSPFRYGRQRKLFGMTHILRWLVCHSNRLQAIEQETDLPHLLQYPVLQRYLGSDQNNTFINFEVGFVQPFCNIISCRLSDMWSLSLMVVFLFRIVQWSPNILFSPYWKFMWNQTLANFYQNICRLQVTGKNNTYFIFPKEAVSNRTNCWSSVFNLQYNKVRKFYNFFDSWTWNPDSCYRINIPVYYLSNVPCKQI